nr:2-amino-4-hydroxy-6-hydroxymethyldihydropteridine diphosphokinase [Deinobacterium chartae]
MIALGGNLGDPLATLRQAVCDLEALGRVSARSRLYRTAPVGGPDGQPDYLNAAIRLETDLPPRNLLLALLELERRHGRERRERWGARTLDLDLLAWGDVLLEEPDLVLPHPRMFERAFVLCPLADVAPRWTHPRTGMQVLEAAARVDTSGVQRTELNW